jgi:hypothetical protein
MQDSKERDNTFTQKVADVEKTITNDLAEMRKLGANFRESLAWIPGVPRRVL